MLSVSVADTDNTDRTDKTITRAAGGWDSGSDSASGRVLLLVQAQVLGCRLVLDAALASDLEPDWAPESAPD